MFAGAGPARRGRSGAIPPSLAGRLEGELFHPYYQGSKTRSPGGRFPRRRA